MSSKNFNKPIQIDDLDNFSYYRVAFQIGGKKVCNQLIMTLSPDNSCGAIWLRKTPKEYCELNWFAWVQDPVKIKFKDVFK